MSDIIPRKHFQCAFCMVEHDPEKTFGVYCINGHFTCSDMIQEALEKQIKSSKLCALCNCKYNDPIYSKLIEVNDTNQILGIIQKDTENTLEMTKTENETLKKDCSDLEKRLDEKNEKIRELEGKLNMISSYTKINPSIINDIMERRMPIGIPDFTFIIEDEEKDEVIAILKKYCEISSSASIKFTKDPRKKSWLISIIRQEDRIYWKCDMGVFSQLCEDDTVKKIEGEDALDLIRIYNSKLKERNLKLN